MDDDSELLDWGQDEENHFNGDRHHRFSNSYDHKRNGDPDDVEDAVSLGGDEDDIQDFIALPSHADQTGATIEQREAPASSSDRLASRKRDANAEPPISHPKEQTPQVQSPPPQSSPLRPLTHALPPKPIVSDASFLSLPSTTAASPMSMARRDKERRANGITARHIESAEPLSADWEMRYSRGSDREVYYYNLKTHESTWNRPGTSRAASPNLRGRGRSRPETADSRPAGRRDVDDDLSMRASERRGHPELAANEPSHEDLSKKDLSYKDRHYRPEGESAPAAESSVREREEKMSAAPLRSRRDRISPERNVERPLLSRNGSQRASEDSRRPRRSSSVSPRDDPSRRFIESDSYRAGQTYRSSDIGSTQVYANYPRDAPVKRAPPDFDTRPKHADYDAAPSLPKDHFTSIQNTGRSSTLRRRSPSPPPTQYARLGPDRREGDSRSAVPYAPAAPMQSRQSNRPGRATSPPRDWSDSRVRDRGSYAPAEIPQRRGRDVDLGPDEDNDAKRRRLDRRGDSTVSRRATVDSDVFRDRDSSESMSPLPSAHSDQSRQRKRPPLPSQSDRWKESITKPVPPSALAPPAVPSPVDRRPSHAQPPPNAPSGPRSTIAREHIPVEFPPPRRLQENAPPPPRSWGRDSRNPSYSRDFPARHEDAMDVDKPSPPRPPAHEEAPRRLSGYDRPVREEPPIREPPPRAPRAMGARPPASVPTTASPTLSTFPRGPPPSDHPPRSQRDKSPPPARSTWGDDRRLPTEPSHSNRMRESDMRAAGEPERRRLLRDEPSDRPRYPERERPDSGYQGPKESRGPRGRLSDLPPTGPAGGRLPSDPNGPGPLGGRRGPRPPAPPDSYPSSPVDRRGPPSPVERREQFGGGFLDSGPPKAARDYPQRTPSGLSSARGLPPPPQRQELPPQRHEPPPQRPEPSSQQHEPPSAGDSRETSTTQSEDSGLPGGRREQRVSRFGPPKTATNPAPEPPRIWIPRDAIADANYVVDGTRPPPPPPGPPPRATSGSWPRPPEQDTRPPPDTRPPRQSRPSRFGPPVDDQRNRDGRVEGGEPTAQGAPPPPRRAGSFSSERRPGPGFNSNAPLHAHESLPHRPRESFPPPPRPDQNLFVQPPPRGSWNAYGPPRPRPPHGDSIEPMWQQTEANQPPPPPVQDTSTAPAPLTQAADLPTRASKPVKIRRPAPDAGEEPAGAEAAKAQGPGISRRLSLLDRMSSDEQGASLQERMEEGGEGEEEGGAKKRWVKKGRKGKW